MKKLIYMLAGILFSLGLYSQETNPQVSSGVIETSNTSGTGYINLGEPVIGSFTFDQFMGAGFIYQLTATEETNAEPGGSTVEFESTPNPFDNVINVVIDDNSRDKYMVRVINDNGRLIEENERQKEFSLELGYLSAGIYGLLIYDTETKKLLGKRKIVKR